MTTNLHFILSPLRCGIALRRHLAKIGMFSAMFLLGSTLGCANSAKAPRPTPTLAIAVATSRGQPTAQQMANISLAMRSHIAGRGYAMASNKASADYLMTVKYVPDPVNVSGGHLTFMSIEPNSGARVREDFSTTVWLDDDEMAQLRTAMAAVADEGR